jgi:hypothetical protein
MDEVFVTRTSAVERIVKARKALQQNLENTDGVGALDTASRLEWLDRLLVDVRAGRLSDFRIPLERGETRVLVTGD